MGQVTNVLASHIAVFGRGFLIASDLNQTSISHRFAPYFDMHFRPPITGRERIAFDSYRRGVLIIHLIDQNC